MSLGESIVIVQSIGLVELTMIEIDVSFIESEMLCCLLTAFYRF